MKATSSQQKPVTARALHILVVEDEMMLAIVLEDALEDAGCMSTMVSRVGRAALLAASQSFDGAILDVSVAGEQVYPVAEELARRNIPFIFTTGHGENEIRDDFRGRPILQKPYLPDALNRMMQTTFPAT